MNVMNYLAHLTEIVKVNQYYFNHYGRNIPSKYLSQEASVYLDAIAKAKRHSDQKIINRGLFAELMYRDFTDPIGDIRKLWEANF